MGEREQIRVVDARREPFIRLDTDDARLTALALREFAKFSSERLRNAGTAEEIIAAGDENLHELADYLSEWAESWDPKDRS